MAWIIAALVLAAIGYAIYRKSPSVQHVVTRVEDVLAEDKASMKADRTDPQ